MTMVETREPPELRLPTQYELPYEDGIPLESVYHYLQIGILVEALRIAWRKRNDFFVGGNMFLYLDPAQRKDRYFRGRTCSW